MNILVLGSGGREHALAWKLAQSPLCTRLFIAPGNPGTAQLGQNLPFGVNDFAAVEAAVRSHSVAMVVVGPEDPIVNGIWDYMEAAHLRSSFGPQWLGTIGPSAQAAQLEGSKAFSKKFMQRHRIPTAGYAEFTADNYDAGQAYLASHALPIVLKADGLAAGKGVVICQSHQEAETVFADMILSKQFGDASSRVVVEQFLDGVEVSVFALTDGKTYKIVGHAKDYKRIGLGDTGLNTGGMGCVSPVPFAQGAFMQKVIDRIVEPTINGLATDGLVYKGWVFFGLINVGGEPMVIEYNCRLGDPETEVVLPRLQSDLVQLLAEMLRGNLMHCTVETDERAAATVVVVSGGYPGVYPKGIPITGLPIPQDQSAIVFHAGTSTSAQGRLQTNGGRVLALTALGHSVAHAAQVSKALAAQVQFEGAYFRTDIGYEFS
ncbi:MAG: phosphoribosylamine--glycine ligase [Bacteroidetes bacterium]|nr:MAG: phosphoribosylamine--glycine ligase [Bacteroidota bacterium]